MCWEDGTVCTVIQLWPSHKQPGTAVLAYNPSGRKVETGGTRKLTGRPAELGWCAPGSMRDPVLKRKGKKEKMPGD